MSVVNAFNGSWSERETLSRSKFKTDRVSTRLCRKLLRFLIKRTRSQSQLEQLDQLCLEAMNIGSGGDLDSSGEKMVLSSLRQYLSEHERPIIFDVGANVGNYAASVLSILKGEIQLYCFEPSHCTFEALKTRLGMNQRVKSFNFGFDETERNVTLYSNEEKSGLASIYKRRLGHFGIPMNPQETIRLHRIDDFCQEESIRHIDFLKLDVEGNELNVLRGASRLIESQCIDFIQFEFGGCNIDSRTYFQDFFYLLNPHFEIYRVLKHGISHITHYKETYERFITTNFFAIARHLGVAINQGRIEAMRGKDCVLNPLSQNLAEPEHRHDL